MSPSLTDDDPILSELPVLPLRDMVVYPQGVHPLFVGTERSIHALEAAMGSDKQILLVAKRDASQENPAEADLFEVGTVSTILQLLKLPDGTVKVLVEGGFRARMDRLHDEEDYLRADVERLDETRIPAREAEGLVRSVMGQFEQYVQLSKKVPQEVLTSLSSIEEPGRLVDTIAAQLSLKIEEKQKILETVELDKRIEALLALMEGEIDLFQMEKRIRGRVKKQMERRGSSRSSSRSSRNRGCPRRRARRPTRNSPSSR